MLSSNDPFAFACVFGISRAGCVWCPINPRNEAEENRFVLDNFDCEVLFFRSTMRRWSRKLRTGLTKLRLLVCLEGEHEGAVSLDRWLQGRSNEPFERAPVDESS